MTTDTNSNRLESWLLDRLSSFFSSRFIVWLFGWPWIVVSLGLIAWGLASHQRREVLYLGILVLATRLYYPMERWLEELDYGGRHTRRRFVVGLYLTWLLLVLSLVIGLGPAYLGFCVAATICVDGDQLLDRVRNGRRLSRRGIDDGKAKRRQTNRTTIKMVIVMIIAAVPIFLPASWLLSPYRSLWGMQTGPSLQLPSFLFTAIYMATCLPSAIASWRGGEVPAS